MSRFIRKCIIAAGLLCIATASRAELLSEQWWQWILSVPAAITPQLDDTGARASINNDGSVFFLAGDWGGPSTRTINLPVGLPLFFPVLNQAYIFTPATDPTDMSDCSGFGVGDVRAGCHFEKPGQCKRPVRHAGRPAPHLGARDQHGPV